MPDPQQGKPKLDVLKGSLLLKIIILMGVGLIVSVFLLGTPFDFWSLLWSSAKVAIGILLILLVLKGISAGAKALPFSPQSSLKEKIIRAAELAKPFNIRDLYITGEDMRVYSKWGKVTGLLYIPDWASEPVLKANGKPAYEAKRDLDGKIVQDAEGKTVTVPKMKPLTSQDGDWLFITKRGWNPFSQKKELVRANLQYVSAIGEQTWIKTVNLLPIGFYHYPVQQYQDKIIRVLTQHKAEVVVETHEYFLDLIANVTEMSLGADPTFQKIIQTQSEILGSQSRGELIR